jgi:hypothetical protein
MTFRLCHSHSEEWTDSVKLFTQNPVILSTIFFPLCSGLLEQLGVRSYEHYPCSSGTRLTCVQTRQRYGERRTAW